MLVLDIKTNKLSTYGDIKLSKIIYVIEKSISINSKNFKLQKYQEFRKNLLINHNIPNSFKMIPYNINKK